VLWVGLAVTAALSVTMASGGVALAASSDVTVTTRYGPVVGMTTAANRVFKGIPFAAPPTPERGLRWKPPRAPAAWTAPRQAKQVGPRCAQPTFVGAGSVSEDCLYLNVYAPASGSNLPVMVWIHGGGWFLGSGGQFDGSELAARNKVVVVTINYRLGPFGYLALPGLALENSHLSTGNYGLQDQQMALRWVRDNIVGFGGDNHNVTLFGESAGSGSICAHLASPQSAGLFQKAITESQSCTNPGNTMSNLVAQIRSTEYAGAAGCGSLLPGAVVACMRRKSAADLLAAFGPPSGSTAGLFGFSKNLVIQSVDGYYLPRSTRDAITLGLFNRVPMLSGTNRHEGRLIALTDFDLAGRPLNADDYVQGIADFLQPTVGAGSGLAAQMVAGLYPLRNFPAPSGYDPYTAPAHLAFGAWLTDSLFACAHSGMYDQLAPKLIPTYSYEFADPGPPLYANGTLMRSSLFPLGPAHGSEIAYVFGMPVDGSTPYQGMTAAQKTLSQQMQRYWTNFARTGNPNGSGLTTWPRYRLPTGGQILALKPDATTTTDRAAFNNAHQCGVWSTVEPLEAAVFSLLLLF
jgi:para-nitrobenzyl esterase